MLNKNYTAAWVTWLLLTVSAFFAIELPALIDPAAGDTLTEHVFQWLGLASRDEWIGRFALALFFAWVVHHFMRPRKGG